MNECLEYFKENWLTVIPVLITIIGAIGGSMYKLGKHIGEKNNDIKEFETMCEVLNKHNEKEYKAIKDKSSPIIVFPWVESVKVFTQNRKRFDCNCRYLLRNKKCELQKGKKCILLD